MGEVYRARDPKLQRDVAIKVLAADVVADRERFTRLEREALLLASLSHPNIATIHSLEEADGKPFLVLELIEGESLEERLRRGPLETEEALDIGRQIASALEAAHTGGVVHRDLKPANVLISPDGHAKVLDFGIAKAQSPGQASKETAGATELTADGTLVGTAPYMSPEQIRAQQVDKRTDIWSFGCLLFEILGGAGPFQRETLADTLAAVLDHEPNWDALPTATPPEIVRLIRRCLQKEARNRLHDIADARIELTEVLAGESATGDGAGVKAGAAHPPAVATTARPGAAATAASRWLGLAGVVTALLLAIVFYSGTTGRWWKGSDQAGMELANQRVISTFTGAHHEATFGPDGTMIAFVSDASGNPEIWIKTLASGEPTQITSGETAASSPSWSPRGDQIVFARAGAGIWTVGPLGSPAERQLIEGGRAPSFSSDGGRIVLHAGTQIRIVDADGTGARVVEGLPQLRFTSAELSPAFSPDGEWIACFQPEEGPTGDLWIVRASGGDARQLTFDIQFGGTPVWTPDGRSIIYSSHRGGSRTLWRVPIDGGDPLPVTSGAGEDTDPAIAADGSALIYTNTRNRYVLKIRDADTGQERELLDRSTVLAIPEFSPAGDRIVLFYPLPDGVHVFTVDLQGQDLRQVTHTRNTRNILPSWPAGGDSIFFFLTYPDHSFRRVPAGGGQSVEVAALGWGSHARVGPDGTSILYSRDATDDTSSATILRDLATGDETLIIEPRLYRMRWSKDGARFAGTRGPQVIVCIRAPGECRTLTSGSFPVWSRDGETIFFRRIRPDTGTYEVWGIGLDGGDERMVADLGLIDPTDGTFDVSVDGDFVWVQYVPGRQELWLAELQ